MPGYAPSKGSSVSMGTQAGTFGGGSNNAAAEAFRSSEAQKMGASNEAQQFFSEQGITASNPYGKQGFFSRVFGIDPKNISYANIMSPTQMSGIAALNYDRYQNPYAATNVLGNPTGAQQAFGVVRSGLKPGDVTRLGTVQAYRQNLTPAGRIAAGLGTLGIPYFGGSMINKGTQVMGLEDSAPIDPDTGMSLSPTRGGIMDILTGGQTDYIGEKTGTMVDSMMNFFSPNQQTTDIQSSDVSIPMSGYSEEGRYTVPPMTTEDIDIYNMYGTPPGLY
jgi:hypothetical protein